MWKVTWNWIGAKGLASGEKVFSKNYQAQSFAYLLMANAAIDETNVEKV